MLAGVCALTDFVWGKVFNKAVLAGLVVAVLWLGAYGAWHAAGGHTSLDDYPELGLWGADAEAAAAAAAALPPPEPGAPQAQGFGADRPQVSVGTEPAGPDARTPPPSATPPEAPPPPEPSFWTYLARAGLNTLLAFVVGFGLWWFGLWAAGDAKLFGALAALVPLSTYQYAFWPAFPSYVLLFNTFLALMVLLVLELVVRFVRQSVRPTPDEAEAWATAWTWVRTHVGELAIGFVGVLFLFLVIKTLRMFTRDLMAGYTDITSNTAVYFVLFLIFQPLSKAMAQHKWLGIPIVLATLGGVAWIGFHPTDEYNLRTVLHMSALSLGLVLFLIAYELYLNVFDFKPVRVWQLKPRMILARRTMEALKEDQDLLDHKMGAVGPDGLRADQAEVLRRWWIDRGKGGRLWISRTIPFAPALFMGTLATVLLGGYLLRL